MDGGAWKAAVHGVVEGRTWLSDFTFTFHFHALEKEMATHPSVLAWRIPGMAEPGGLPSMGSHRVGHDWSDLAAAAAAAGSSVVSLSWIYLFRSFLNIIFNWTLDFFNGFFKKNHCRATKVFPCIFGTLGIVQLSRFMFLSSCMTDYNLIVLMRGLS